MRKKAKSQLEKRLPIERVNREIKRRTKAIGAFPNGQSALMLVCADCAM